MHVAQCCTSASAGKKKVPRKSTRPTALQTWMQERRGLAFVKLTMGVDHLRASRTCPRRLRDGRRKPATCIVPHAHARALAQFVCTVPFKPPSSSMPLLAIETKCLNTPLHRVVSCMRFANTPCSYLSEPCPAALELPDIPLVPCYIGTCRTYSIDRYSCAKLILLPHSRSRKVKATRRKAWMP
jgi:hypothetical protein